MTPFAVAVYDPLLAVTIAVGFTALRLSRRTAPGLVALCIAQAAWVFGLALLEANAVDWAERVLPSGMLLAGAFLQAGREVAGRPRGFAVVAAWVFSAAISLLGFLLPRLFYGPGAVGPGPLFWPLASISSIGTGAVLWELWSAVGKASSSLERRRRLALFAANVFGALGGGGVISLHVLALSSPTLAAPFLLVSVLLAAYAVWSGERGRDRDIVVQGFTHALVTAVFSAIPIVAFFAWLPHLVPGGDPIGLWGVLTAFFAALALDPLRQWIVDRVLGALFERPIAVRALASEVESARREAEHAERLAEIGKLASAVAHEVRNPLGVILTETKLLERAGADAESVSTLRQQVERASRFIDDLLRWARPRSLEPAEFDVVLCVKNAVRQATRSLGLESERVRLETSHAELPFEADQNALEDALVHLLRNALIAAEATNAAVRVRVALEDELCLVVEDDGPGVPLELEPRLFQVFATGRGRDDRHPGTGLGLATSARLVARHGGSLRHERPEEGGARFVIRLPRRVALDV